MTNASALSEKKPHLKLEWIFQPLSMVQSTLKLSIGEKEKKTLSSSAAIRWKQSKILQTKGGFFSESEIRFSNLDPNLLKKLFQKTILSLKFEITTHNSKQLIQISSSG